MNPGDFKHLAELVAYYYENARELKKYGERARSYALSQPTWEGSASKILALLKRSVK